jgi:hypothetical protein
MDAEYIARRGAWACPHCHKRFARRANAERHVADCAGRLAQLPSLPPERHEELFVPLSPMKMNFGWRCGSSDCRTAHPQQVFESAAKAAEHIAECDIAIRQGRLQRAVEADLRSRGIALCQPDVAASAAAAPRRTASPAPWARARDEAMRDDGGGNAAPSQDDDDAGGNAAGAAGRYAGRNVELLAGLNRPFAGAWAREENGDLKCTLCSTVCPSKCRVDEHLATRRHKAAVESAKKVATAQAERAFATASKVDEFERNPQAMIAHQLLSFGYDERNMGPLPRTADLQPILDAFREQFPDDALAVRCACCAMRKLVPRSSAASGRTHFDVRFLGNETLFAPLALTPREVDRLCGCSNVTQFTGDGPWFWLDRRFVRAADGPDKDFMDDEAEFECPIPEQRRAGSESPRSESPSRRSREDDAIVRLCAGCHASLRSGKEPDASLALSNTGRPIWCVYPAGSQARDELRRRVAGLSDVELMCLSQVRVYRAAITVTRAGGRRAHALDKLDNPAAAGGAGPQPTDTVPFGLGKICFPHEVKANFAQPGAQQPPGAHTLPAPAFIKEYAQVIFCGPRTGNDAEPHPEVHGMFRVRPSVLRAMLDLMKRHMFAYRDIEIDEAAADECKAEAQLLLAHAVDPDRDLERLQGSLQEFERIHADLVAKWQALDAAASKNKPKGGGRAGAATAAAGAATTATTATTTTEPTQVQGSVDAACETDEISAAELSLYEAHTKLTDDIARARCRYATRFCRAPSGPRC